jgi:hypothetical protein
MMGLFSFLGGGKKKAAKAAQAPQRTSTPNAAPDTAAVKAEAALAMAARADAPAFVSVSPVSSSGTLPSVGLAQARLRLKLAACLRAGQHVAAYEAAQELAEIQVKAGRPTVARVWQAQAQKIKAAIAA